MLVLLMPGLDPIHAVVCLSLPHANSPAIMCNRQKSRVFAYSVSVGDLHKYMLPACTRFLYMLPSAPTCISYNSLVQSSPACWVGVRKFHKTNACYYPVTLLTGK